MSHRICFIGGPGTGKSTLAQALVPKMKLAGLDAEFCGEYAREYIRRCGAPETPFEQFAILSGASDREDELDVHDFIVCDSGSFVSDVYYQFERQLNHRDGNKVKLDRGYEEIVRLSRTRLELFSTVVYVPLADFGTVSDPTRVYTDGVKLLDRLLRSYLDYTMTDYYTVQSTVFEERLDEVVNYLQSSAPVFSSLGARSE